MPSTDWMTEFIVTVLAILAGFVLGKLLSQQLERYGIPIAAGDPIPVAVAVSNESTRGPWSKAVA